MIATITHELKNPLTSIAGHVELLEDEGLAPVSVGAIIRNVARLQTLVEDMLLLTKIKDPHRPFVPVQVDLSGLVKEVCDAVGIQASRRQQRIDTSAVAAGLRVWGEPDELARALTNVLGNAIKYTPDGGDVLLSVQQEADHVVIACADTGIGIAAEDLGTLFEEFDRSSNPAAHAVPGTGLGLAIVRRIVDRHAGDISVESRLGVGSTFRMRLPGIVD
jgi:signal transduction histidine kinase